MTQAATIRVLVVDDQQTYRDAAQFVIEMSDGFELAGTAASAEEGIGLANLLQPDLILMDINLPGLNGIEATRRIVSEHPATNVIVFSTHAASDYESLAQEAGAIGFISKAELDPDRLTQLWHASRD